MLKKLNDNLPPECGVHTVPIMAPVWDQTSLRHEKRKGRITILSDVECPIIVWTQLYGSGMVRKVGQTHPTV